MATTVKIRDEDKEKLDRLRAHLLLKGIKLNQEELLSKIITISETHQMLFDEEGFEPLSDKQIEEIMKLTFSLGKSSHKTIDEELYGE